MVPGSFHAERQMQKRKQNPQTGHVVLQDGVAIAINLNDGEKSDEAFLTISIFYLVMMIVCMAIYFACKHGII